MKNLIFKFIAILTAVALVSPVFASDEDSAEKYDPVGTVMHHISDANEFHIVGDIHLPLPCMLYSSDDGFRFFMSSKFHHGSQAVHGYVLNHGRVNRILNGPQGIVELDGLAHHEHEGHNEGEHGEEAHTEEHHEGHHYVETIMEDGEEVSYVYIDGEKFQLEKPSTLVAMTSFYDFSITKNVFGMLVASIILLIVFLSVAKAAKNRKGQAPTGLQNFMEPFFVFIRDEVTVPMIGEKHYERFQPFIMTVFFFVLVLNLLGLVPFFPGSANVTGNIAVTLVLAFFTFIITNINGNKHYWQHILWMPGIPAAVKVILTPVEVLGIIIKPFSLMIRLFANITAGHIIILSLVGLIFVFGNAGASMAGASVGALIAVPFTMFMNIIEVIVAFIQAFIFAILSASYIGAAVEDGHHHEEAAH